MFNLLKRRSKSENDAEHIDPQAPIEAPPNQDDFLLRAKEESRVLYGNVGLHDATRSGWFLNDTNELFSGFPLSDDQTLVDIGCGGGGNLKFCVPRVKHAIGIDIDSTKLETTNATLESAGFKNFNLIASNADPIPLDDHVADRVVCTEVLEHVDDPNKTMAELFRIGKPGSLYLISVPGQLSEELLKPIAPSFWFEHPNHIRTFSKADFEKLIKESNLVIERQEFVGFYWAIWHALLCLCDVEHHTGTHPALDLWSKAWDAVLADKPAKERIHLIDKVLHKSHIIIARKPYQ